MKPNLRWERRTTVLCSACATLVFVGAVACGETSSGDDGSGGSTPSNGGQTSSGGRSGTGGDSGGSGGDAGQGGENSGGSAGSATGGESGTENGGNGGRGGTTAAGGSGGAGMGGGGSAGAPPDDVVTDPPTDLTNIGADNDLEITHSHFYIDPEAQPANTWTWLAVVRSHRTDIACDIQVEADFVNPGSTPIKIYAEVATSIYRLSDASSVFRCIPPGEVGIASGAALDGRPQVEPDSVTDIHYAITGTLGPDYVPGEWVTISGVEVAAEGAGNVVRGTFTNGSSQMAWWEANVYPMNSRGMPLIQFILRDATVQLPAGATWDFETPPYDADFEDAYVFVRHARAE